jgi:hypothetical protein
MHMHAHMRFSNLVKIITRNFTHFWNCKYLSQHTPSCTGDYNIQYHSAIISELPANYLTIQVEGCDSLSV